MIVTQRHPCSILAVPFGNTPWRKLLFLFFFVLFPSLQNSSSLRAIEGSRPGFAGERLIFRVDWSPPWYLFFLPTMDAGEAEINLALDATYGDKKAARITFEARSSGTLASLAGIRVDDHYEFMTDPETFCTYSVLKRIREGKRKRDIEVVYLPETRQLHFRETDVAVNPPVVKKDENVNDIPSCVRDPFSALYALRKEEFSVGATYTSLVANDSRTKDIRSRVEKREVTDTPLGKYSAWKIETVALMGGLFKDGGQFRIWLTADDRKVPVQFEVKVSLGKVTGKIKSIQRPD